MTMQRSLDARHMHPPLARSATIELGGEFARRCVAYNGQGLLDGVLADDRWSASSLGTWFYGAGSSVKPDPALDRCLANVESSCNLRIALVPGFVRDDDTNSKFDRMGFRHAPPDQKRILNSSPRINRGEHWG